MSKIKLVTNKNAEIPLKNVKVCLDVCNNIGQFTLIQTYFNDDSNPIEAHYIFPVQANASIYDFSAKIEDKIIKTILKEKDEARKNYNDAISEGNGAFLMERIDSDIFSICVGNIPSKKEVIIQISYIIEIKNEIDCKQLRILIPMTMMPKYLSDQNMTEELILQNKLVNPIKIYDKPYNFEIYGTIFMNDGIIGVDSKTCKIKIMNIKKTSMDFEICNIENLDEDIILTVNRERPQTNALIQKAENLNLNNEIFRYCTMVNIIPDFKNIPDTDISELHYTLILDRSGSMEGADLINCKEAAKIFIKALPPNSSFDIYHFGSDYKKFCYDEQEIANQNELRKKTIKWIDNIKCEGGTEIYNVLQDAYESFKQKNKNGSIILLTDGGVSNVEDVLKLVRDNKNINMFTIGIGQSVSLHLIQSMANEGNGKAEFINSDNDQLKDKVLAQLKRAQTCIKKLQKNNKIDIQVDGNYKMVPEVIPTLFENDVNTFYIFSQNEMKTITYTQILESYNLTTNIQLNQMNYDEYLLHRMAGIRLIEHLQNTKKGSQIPHLKQDPKKEEIILTSLNLNILSKYTSFIGIEYREEKITVPLILKEIPLQIAKKYNLYGPQGLQGPQGPAGPMGPSQGIISLGSKLANGSFDLDLKRDTKLSNTIFPWRKHDSASLEIFPEKQFDTSQFNNLFDAISQSDKRESFPFFGLPPCWSEPEGTFNAFDNFYANPFNYDSDCDYIKKKYIDLPDLIEMESHDELNRIMNFSKNNLEKVENGKSKLKNNIKIKYTIYEKLNFIDLGEVITSIDNESLPFTNDIKIGDYICLNSEGIFKVITIGSINSKWILEKVKLKID